LASAAPAAAHQPKDPAFAERVRASFAKQSVMALLGARIARLEPGAVDLEMPHDARFTQQDGYLHAGIVTTLVDSAGGYAAYTLMPSASSVLSVEFKLNFMAPAKGERYTGKGRVVRAGRTLTVVSFEVVAHDGAQETTVAAGLATMMCLERKA
jgi:uncharacterized protein (TIGR00369 family)